MPEFWQDVTTRADASNGIWQTFNPTFKAGELTLAAHQADTVLLATRNQEKVTQEGVADAARDARNANLAVIRDLAIRVPRAFEATLPPEDSLMDDIELLRNTPLDGAADIQSRGQDVLTLWTNGNLHRAAQSPAQAALVVGGKAVAVLQAALTGVQPLEATLSTERGALSKARSTLRTLTAKVDRNNKRWYLAWLAEYLPGTPENDALSLIDTGSPANPPPPPPPPPPAPTALEIASFVVDDPVATTLTYDPAGGADATTLILQYKLPGEPDFGHDTVVVRPAQQVVNNDFSAALVVFRTVVSNGTGSATSGEQSIQF